MSNIKGIGIVGVRDENSWYPIHADTFTANEEVETEEVEGHPLHDCGPKQVLDIVHRKSTFTVKLGTGVVDNQSLGVLGFNQKESASSVIVLPDVFGGQIPAVAPYEIPIAGLTTNSIVSVTILTSTDKIAMNRAAAPASNTFQVDAGKIIFDAGDAGKQLSIYTRKSLTVKSIGGAAPIDRYDNVEIIGQICGTRLAKRRIWFPNCSSITGMSIDPAAATIERDYRASIPPELPWNLPYISWEAA